MTEDREPRESPSRPAAGGGRRRNKAETHDAILDAAVALFSARGYDATSITSIARRADVSRAAVFWHFNDKDGLFREAFQHMLVPFLDELKGTLGELEPRRRILELFDVYERFVASHRDAIQSIVRWVLESPELRARLQGPLLALVDEFVRDLQDPLSELTEDEEEAASLAAALTSSLHGNLLLSLLDPNPQRRLLRASGLRRLAEQVLARGGQA